MTAALIETGLDLVSTSAKWAPGLLLFSLGALAGALVWLRVNDRRERFLKEDLSRHLTAMFSASHPWGGILLFAISRRQSKSLDEQLIASAESPEAALRVLCQRGAMPWSEPCWLRLEATALHSWVQQTAESLSKVPVPDRRLPRAHSLYALVVAAAQPLTGKYTPELLSEALSRCSEVAVVNCALPTTEGSRRFSQQTQRWLPLGAIIATGMLALISLLLVHPLAFITGSGDASRLTPRSSSTVVRDNAVRR